MNGTIESITTDWRGDTLTAALISADTEIAVGDTSDFDEDGGWLTIAGSAPIAYLTADEDAETITLAGTVGAAYEAGDPVAVWDPTVLPAGAQVVEYVASVMTDRGAVPATIPHEKIPMSGVDRLIGASVGLAEDDDGDWYVAQVYGRESSVDQSYVDTPFITLYQPTDKSRPDSPTFTFSTVKDWAIQDAAPGAFTYDNTTGAVTMLEAGLYLFTVAVAWAGNSSGRRSVQLVTAIGGVDEVLRTIPGSPPDAAIFTQQIVVCYRAVAGETFHIEAWQSSGAALDVLGSSTGKRTAIQAVRLQA